MSESGQIVFAFIGGIGVPELLVVFAIVLLLFGGQKLPEVARSMGGALRAFRDESQKMRREIDLDAEFEQRTNGESYEGSPRASEASSNARRSGEASSSQASRNVDDADQAETDVAQEKATTTTKD